MESIANITFKILVVMAASLTVAAATNSIILRDYLASYDVTTTTQITVENININDVESYAFANFTQLRTLKFPSGLLLGCHPDAFRGTLLWHLLMRNQLLTSIPSLHNYAFLRIADFGYNQITSVTSDVFNGTAIQDLRLYGNSLTCIPDLGDVSSLLSIGLDGNNLSTCLTQPAPLANINKLYINTVGTSNVSDLYSLTPNVEILYIEDNEIREIPFDFPLTIRSLAMGKNLITDLQMRVFARYPALTQVALNENDIEYVNPRAWKSSAITFLTLAKNRIKCIPDFSEIHAIIQFITLAYNSITDCSDGDPGLTLPALTHLYLQDNSLTLTPAIVTMAPKLTMLNLMDNHLITLPDMTLTHGYLIQADARGNQLVCGCIHRWIKVSIISKLSTHLNCSKTENLDPLVYDHLSWAHYIAN